MPAGKPFSFSGTFLLAENKEEIDITIEEIEPFRPIQIVVNLADKNTKTYIDGYGTIFYDADKPDEWLNFEGILASKNISLFLEKFGVRNWPKEPIVGSFTFKSTPKKSLLESLTIRQGEGEEGTSFFMGLQDPNNKTKKIPTLVVKNIDAEKWLPFLHGATLSSFFNQLKTDFYVQIEEARFRSEFLKQIFVEGNLENGVLNFSTLTAQLPYESSFSGKGALDFQEKKIDTDVQFQSGEFRSFIEWFLQKKMSFFPENQLKKVQWEGHMEIQPNGFDFKIENATIDETQVSGYWNMKDSNFNTDLEVNGLFADTYLNSGKNILDSLFSSIVAGKFNLKMQNLKIREYFFNEMDIEGNLNENGLSLEKFNGTSADGSTLTGKFFLEKAKDKEKQIGTLKTDFSIPNLENYPNY